MPTMLLHMAETSTTTIVVVISYIVIAIIVVVVSIEIKCTMKIFIICWHFFLLSTFFFQQHHHHHILSYWCLCKWKGCVRSVLDLAEFRSVSFDSFLSNQQDSATKLRIHFSEREKREKIMMCSRCIKSTQYPLSWKSFASKYFSLDGISNDY